MTERESSARKLIIHTCDDCPYVYFEGPEDMTCECGGERAVIVDYPRIPVTCGLARASEEEIEEDMRWREKVTNAQLDELNRQIAMVTHRIETLPHSGILRLELKHLEMRRSELLRERGGRGGTR